MPWQDDEIAGPMGYKHCVLFDCARDALRAYPYDVAFPTNICPSVLAARPAAIIREIDQETGLAPGTPVHLYGYQSPITIGFGLSLDPLMTGWVRRLKTESAIVSFGHKKMLSIGYGGAFLTSNRSVAEDVQCFSRWNNYYTSRLLQAIEDFGDEIKRRWDVVHLWDRYLGDSLIRIPGEQLMPWRVMRRAPTAEIRAKIVRELRGAGLDVGTNYPPLTGQNEWGATVLNFFCEPDVGVFYIQRSCSIIREVVGG